MRKPLRRSFTFWFGWLVLSFLIWVWVDSFTTWTSWAIPRKHDYGPVRNSLRAGVIEMSWDEVPGHRYPLVQKLAGGRYPAWNPVDPWAKTHWWPERHWVHEARVATPGGEVPLREHHLSYPFWMLIVIYLVLWGVLLLVRREWWRRRQRRLGQPAEGMESNKLS